MIELIATLVVMTLVLAVIALFTVSVNNNTKRKLEVTQQMKEMEGVRDFIETWYYTFDTNGYALLLPAVGEARVSSTLTIRKRNSVETYTLTFNDGVVTANMADGTVDTYTCDFIDTCNFEPRGSDDFDSVFKCRLEYMDSDEERNTFTFLLGKHA